MKKHIPIITFALFSFTSAINIDAQTVNSYPVVDTGQTQCFNNHQSISCPFMNESFYGQDSNYIGNQPNYTLSGDGLTVYDNVTGLTWQQNPDRNGDGTVTDQATSLMWMQSDSLTNYNWQEALEYAEQLEYAGYDDWRLPNIKELQSIVDYTRSPDTHNSAAIDPIFNTTAIINEAGETDFPAYWSSTTHVTSNGMGASGCYVSFGRSLGYMNGTWLDVHGAGSQRSD